MKVAKAKCHVVRMMGNPENQGQSALVVFFVHNKFGTDCTHGTARNQGCAC